MTEELKDLIKRYFSYYNISVDDTVENYLIKPILTFVNQFSAELLAYSGIVNNGIKFDDDDVASFPTHVLNIALNHIPLANFINNLPVATVDVEIRTYLPIVYIKQGIYKLSSANKSIEIYIPSDIVIDKDKSYNLKVFIITGTALPEKNEVYSANITGVAEIKINDVSIYAGQDIPEIRKELINYFMRNGVLNFNDPLSRRYIERAAQDLLGDSARVLGVDRAPARAKYAEPGAMAVIGMDEYKIYGGYVPFESRALSMSPSSLKDEFIFNRLIYEGGSVAVQPAVTAVFPDSPIVTGNQTFTYIPVLSYSDITYQKTIEFKNINTSAAVIDIVFSNSPFGMSGLAIEINFPQKRIFFLYLSGSTRQMISEGFINAVPDIIENLQVLLEYFISRQRIFISARLLYNDKVISDFNYTLFNIPQRIESKYAAAYSVQVNVDVSNIKSCYTIVGKLDGLVADVPTNDSNSVLNIIKRSAQVSSGYARHVIAIRKTNNNQTAIIYFADLKQNKIYNVSVSASGWVGSMEDGYYLAKQVNPTYAQSKLYFIRDELEFFITYNDITYSPVVAIVNDQLFFWGITQDVSATFVSSTAGTLSITKKVSSNPVLPYVFKKQEDLDIIAIDRSNVDDYDSIYFKSISQDDYLIRLSSLNRGLVVQFLMPNVSFVNLPFTINLYSKNQSKYGPYISSFVDTSQTNAIWALFDANTDDIEQGSFIKMTFVSQPLPAIKDREFGVINVDAELQNPYGFDAIFYVAAETGQEYLCEYHENKYRFKWPQNIPFETLNGRLLFIKKIGLFASIPVYYFSFSSQIDYNQMYLVKTTIPSNIVYNNYLKAALIYNLNPNDVYYETSYMGLLDLANLLIEFWPYVVTKFLTKYCQFSFDMTMPKDALYSTYLLEIDAKPDFVYTIPLTALRGNFDVYMFTENGGWVYQGSLSSSAFYTINFVGGSIKHVMLVGKSIDAAIMLPSGIKVKNVTKYKPGVFDIIIDLDWSTLETPTTNENAVGFLAPKDSKVALDPELQAGYKIDVQYNGEYYKFPQTLNYLLYDDLKLVFKDYVPPFVDFEFRVAYPVYVSVEPKQQMNINLDNLINALNKDLKKFYKTSDFAEIRNLINNAGLDIVKIELISPLYGNVVIFDEGSDQLIDQKIEIYLPKVPKVFKLIREM